ncbi:sensor histidine kinase [Chthonobacter albigriseus]|uniref:sensor histidine kinase n=1 Tax=Chthonobacter albigriseus TaxID=1683161 RepID=UPI0015EEE9BD|nr:histidine kinase dimerization/phosphoacceptor domain -containing protein [Chthonobacter albigriseus]
MNATVPPLARMQFLFITVGLIALASIVSVAFWLDRRSSELAVQTLAARDLKTAAVVLREALQRAESSQRGFLYTNNEVYLAPFSSARIEARRVIADIPSRVEGYETLEPLIPKLRSIIDDKFLEIEETIDLARSQRSREALDVVLTNRGKALMDESNIYITGVSLAADQRLSTLVGEQARNAELLRLVSVTGALVAVLSVGAALLTLRRYAAELVRARDALSAINGELEHKVALRTADLIRRTEQMREAKDRAELLMREVYHRVANSLGMVSALVRLQSNALEDQTTKAVLEEIQSRIQAVAMVHQRLYQSDDVSEVALDDYLRSMLEQFQSMMGQHNRIRLKFQLEPLALKTDSSINLGVIAAEWVMNAAKYAYPDRSGEVRVSLSRTPDGKALLAVEDDGTESCKGEIKGTGLGTRIVKAMARAIDATIDYEYRQPGFTARLAFPLNSS